MSTSALGRRVSVLSSEGDFLRKVGAFALGLAVAAVIAFPVTYLTVALALAATILLAVDRRLGPLPAALLVVLALPYDRAANIFLPRIMDIPVRPQDAAIAAGVLMALPRLRRWRSIPRTAALPIALFLALGLVAAVIGIVEHNAGRDILRDARWWALYGVAILALASGARRASIVRGLLIGTTVFAVLVIVASMLPVFVGGLKARSLEFDAGLLRMQFGNSALLLLALAYATVRAARRQRPVLWLWVVLIATAVVLSLTRTLIVFAAGVVLLSIAGVLISQARMSSAVPRMARAALPAVVSIGIAFALAVNVNAFANQVTRFPVRLDLFGRGGDAAIPAAQQEDVVDRLLLQSPISSLDTLEGGRFQTYRRAVGVIAARPILGSGLGALVTAEYTFGGEPFDTPGKLPNVDNAYLTVGMKAGVVGMVALALLLIWPLFGLIDGRKRRLAAWLAPGWLGLLALTMTQSFATTGYGPFALGLLAVLPWLGYARSNASRALRQE